MKLNKNAISLMALAMSCTAAMTSGVAFAQDVASTAAPANNSGIEVVVTARKRSERLLDVPVPVTSITSSNLLKNDDVKLSEIYTKIPGLSVVTVGNGRGTVAIRGITTAGSNPTVGFTVDDVPIGSSTGAGIGSDIFPEINPSDLKAIEVLRGPQGALYGASSMGGLIKYVTLSPNTHSYSSDIAISGSTVAHGGQGYGIRGGANFPLVEDKLALRVSGFMRTDPGFIDDIDGRKDTNSADSHGMHAALLWNITPDINYTLSGTYDRTRYDGTSDMDILIDHSIVYGKYEHSRLIGTGTSDKQIQLYTGVLNADLHWANLAVITGYSDTSFDGPQDVSKVFSHYIPLPSWGIDNYGQTKKFTQEVRLTSPGGTKLDWLIGAYYGLENNLNKQNVYVADTATGADTTNDIFGEPSAYNIYLPTRYIETAVFGGLTYHFTEKFDVQVGARYAQSSQNIYELDSGVLNGGVSDSTMSSHDQATTFSVTPSYHISKNLMVYARVASGYRPGGPNSVPGNPLIPKAYAPDYTLNSEIGFKGMMFDHKLSVDASLFNIAWQDIQLEQLDPVTAFSYTGNGGKAHSRGLELAVAYSPLPDLTVSGNYAYTDAALDEDVIVSSLYGLKGDQLPFVAKNAGSISADKGFTLFDKPAHVSATIAYIDTRQSLFVRKSTTERYEMPSYVTLGMNFDIDLGKGLTLNIYGKNLTDKLAYLSGSPRDTVTRSGVYSAGVLTPRTIGLSLEKKF